MESLSESLVAIEELIAEGDFEEAEEALNAAFEAHGEQEGLLLLRAELALESEDFQECVVAVEAGLGKVESEEARGQLQAYLGYARFYLDQLNEARKSFNEAVRLTGGQFSALVGRAMVHEEMFFLRAALLDVDRAIAIDDQEPQPFAIRASIYLRLGQNETAKKDFAEAVRLDPEDEESRLNLARLLATERKTSEAIETLEPLVEDGEDPDFIVPAALLRSQLSLTLGSTEVAMDDAKTAMEHTPDEPWGYLQMAACHLTAGNAGKAIEVLKEAESRVSDVRDVPDILALKASAYDQLEKPEKAAEFRNQVEGSARLPSIVYGEILNPAQNIPLNPNKPIDVRALLTQLFGDASRAPAGYEKAVRDVLDRLPQVIQQNPGVGQIRIELPQVEGMDGPPKSLVVQVNPQAQAQKDAGAQQ